MLFMNNNSLDYQKLFDEIKQIVLYKDNGWAVFIQNLVKHFSDPYKYPINLRLMRKLDNTYKKIAYGLIDFYYYNGDLKPFESLTEALEKQEKWDT